MMNFSLRKKRPISLIVILLGFALFATAALADLTSGSPYADLKAALKQTLGFTQGVNRDSAAWANHTTTSMISFSLDGQVQMRGEEVTKHALDQKLSESKSLGWFGGVEESFLCIEDGNTNRMISKSSKEEIWNVVENYPTMLGLDQYNLDGLTTMTGSSFYYEAINDARFADIERIFDAAIGSLANLVQAEPTSDGGYRYFGTAINAQLPPLVQALGGFMGSQLSYTRFGPYSYVDAIPTMRLKDMSIDRISGEALVTPEGWISMLTFSLHFHGMDETGMIRQAQLDMGYEVFDIGVTTVLLPDLTGQQVAVERFDSWSLDDEDSIPMFSAKDFGHYMSVESAYTSQGWQKLLERHLTIAESGPNLECRYWEVYLGDGSFSPVEASFTLPNSQSRFSKGQEINASGVDAAGNTVSIGGYLWSVVEAGQLQLTIYDSRDTDALRGEEYLVWDTSSWRIVFDE